MSRYGASMTDAYRLYRQGLDALADGHADEAIAPLERARGLEPDSNSVREALGTTYMKIGFHDRAVAEFEVIVERDPVDAYAHFCLGRAYDKLGAPMLARQHYRLAAFFGPERRIFRETLSSFLARTSMPELDDGERPGDAPVWRIIGDDG
jgi:Flp pilus assembly protein TadD